MKQILLHRKNSSSLQEPATGREGILRTLAYFDIFNYPLTKKEILEFLVRPLNGENIDELLEQMIADKDIFCHHDLFSLQNNILLVHRRWEGNDRAIPLLKKANSIGRFLFKFPYVRAIGVSGSLSKNFADEKSDIDYFIITKANRLWIARTIMHLYKKLTFLSGRQNFYCMNYYVDEKALSLKEKNIYTATELKTLLPIAGENAISQLFQENHWANEWFPQCNYRKQSQPDLRNGFLKRLAEWLFDNRLGNWLDNHLQKITTGRWMKKEAKGDRNSHGLVMGLIADKHFAYSNSGSFREKVLSLYEKKLQELGIN